MRFGPRPASAIVLAALLHSFAYGAPGTGGFPTLRNWGEAQGIDLAFVTATAQTLDGFLWFGTPSGLFRFNGYEFRAMDPRDPGATHHTQITSLLADRDGTLWIGTLAEGLYRHDHGRFTAYGPEHGITNDRIKCLAQDAHGTIWVGTDGGGVFQSLNDRFVPFDPPERGVWTHPTAFATDRDQRLWIGTFRGSLAAVRSGEVEVVLTRGPTIKALLADRLGTLWMGTGSGLGQLVNGKAQRVPLVGSDGQRHLQTFVTSLHQDPWGGIWVGTLTGLVCCREQAQEYIGIQQGLGNGLVTSVFADREGSVWIGTEIGDLYQLNRKKIHIASPYSKGLPSISTLATAPDGRLWIGGAQGIAYRDPDATRFTHLPALSPPIEDVTSLGIDDHGRVWFGNRLGDWGVLEGDSVTRPSTQSLGPGQRSPTFFLQTRHHGFLIGTEGGLYRLGADRSLTPWSDLALSHRDVSCAVETPDGTLWIGTGNGLNRVRSGECRSFIDIHPRPIEQVADLLLDAEDTLWVSTYRGLWRIRGDAFFAFGPEHGAPPTAGPLLEDPAGNLWVGQGSHLARFAKTNLHAVADGTLPRLSPQSWSGIDGLRSPILATGRIATRTPDGYLHFATDKGVASVHPSEPPTNSVPPTPTIEKVTIDGQPAPTTAHDSHASPTAFRVELAPGYHRLDIHFTALSYVAPERVRYFHRLRGLSDQWEDAQNSRIASFRALPAGEYAFEVLAENDAGVRALAAATLRVHVPAPWWRTGTFQAGVTGGVALLAGAFYSLRIRRLKQLGDTRREYSRRLLEHEEKERDRLAKELHDGLGQDLLIIKNHAALLGLQWPHAPLDVRQRLHDITQASQTAIDQARTLAHSLRPAELTRVGLTAALQDMIDRAAASSPIRFQHDLRNADGHLSQDAEVLVYRITQELVNNILKHSRATLARIGLHVLDGALELTVADDGQGFDPESARQDSGSRRGLGLDSITERVAMLSGTVRIESSPGNGSHSLLRIPIQKPH